jgi:ABC-2 type transport system ATP-binding protein
MIHIQNLSFSYNRNHQLFDHLDLTLPPGNIYGLLGKNGAGKSTLLKIISGLLFPKSGELHVTGFKPGDRLPRFLQEVYFVSEEFTLPKMKIDSYVRICSPFYPRFSRTLFNTYINEFKLPPNQYLSALSYGQKKNFLLSFGLATDSKLLILDEPTNGLDIPSKSQFRKILANAIHEERSFIISTHQVRDMENLIDPIIILDEGRIIFYEPCEAITGKLVITRQQELTDDERIIYSESHLGGHTIVKENTGHEETKLNLEILFNAVLANPEKINTIFKN